MRVVTAPEQPEIDIKTVLGANTVFHYHYGTKKLSTDHYEGCIGSLVKRKNSDGFVAAAERGFGYIAAEGAESSPTAPLKIDYFANPLPQVLPSTRMLNDAACDSEGRLIAGVKTRRGDPFNEDQKPGSFWRVERIEQEWKMEQIDDGMTVPNGIVMNKAGSILYMNDTRAPHILAYDYDAESGKVSGKRIFAKTEYKGRPDGLCLDEDDCIWVAKYEGAAVTRYRPDGTIDMEVRFPTSLFITAPCFGGPNMDILFVTTGSLKEAGYAEAESSRWPHCGAVFAVHIPAVKGVEKRKFAW